MAEFVLKMEEERTYMYFDGYYTGQSYIYQGAKYACVSKNIKEAKIYTSKKRAENACNMEFANYRFKIKEI